MTQPFVPVPRKVTTAGTCGGRGFSVVKATAPVIPVTPTSGVPLHLTHTLMVSLGRRFASGAMDAVTVLVRVPVHVAPPGRVIVTGGGGPGHDPAKVKRSTPMRNKVQSTTFFIIVHFFHSVIDGKSDCYEHRYG